MSVGAFGPKSWHFFRSEDLASLPTDTPFSLLPMAKYVTGRADGATKTNYLRWDAQREEEREGWDERGMTEGG